MPQKLLNQAWEYLTLEEGARLRQLHQQSQQSQQSQQQPQRVKWVLGRIGEYLLLKVEGAIATVQSLMTQEILPIPLSELELA